MGVMSHDSWVATMLVLQFAGAVYGAKIMQDLFKIFGTVDTAQSRLSAHESENEVLCACCFRKLYTPWQLTMRMTVASVFCLFLYSFFGVIIRIMFFLWCDMCTTRAALWFIACMGVVFGYVFMFVVHFERLRLTFKDSALALPKWAPKLMYAAVVFYIVMFVTNILTRFSNPPLAAASLMLVVVDYLLCVAYLIRAFYTKTTFVANAAPRDDELLESAVRITIVVVVSLLSTTIALGSWVVILMVCPNCHIWELMGNALVTFDFCLSSFCLLCTFASAEKRYKAVFGGVHKRLVKREASGTRTVTAMSSSERLSDATL